MKSLKNYLIFFLCICTLTTCNKNYKNIEEMELLADGTKAMLYLASKSLTRVEACNDGYLVFEPREFDRYEKFKRLFIKLENLVSVNYTSICEISDEQIKGLLNGLENLSKEHYEFGFNEIAYKDCILPILPYMQEKLTCQDKFIIFNRMISFYVITWQGFNNYNKNNLINNQCCYECKTYRIK